MKKRIKKALKMLAVGAVLFMVAGALVVGCLYQRPSIRFLLNQAGFRQPVQCTPKEVFVPVEGERISVLVYRDPSSKSDRYWYFQHGNTEQTNKHPALDRLARSLCDATGMTVLIPALISSGETGTVQQAFQKLAATYQTLNEGFPGRYRAFGVCLGANLLLAALRRVPDQLYPEKMLLLSPAYSGKVLVRAYRKMFGSDREHDLVFKMTSTLDKSVFDEQEQALIRDAMSVSGNAKRESGPMRQVQGEKLFHEMVVFDTNRKALERIGAKTIFDQVVDRPPCTYFIIHSKQDYVIPYYEGENLARYMQDTGISSDFLGTELLSHAENKVTVTGFLREAQQLTRFFDRLFEGDV
jgi:hypothetical protein